MEKAWEKGPKQRLLEIAYAWSLPTKDEGRGGADDDYGVDDDDDDDDIDVDDDDDDEEEEEDNDGTCITS